MIAVWELLRLQPEHTEALPAIVITMVLPWLYLAFTSYFIVWSGNLASLVGWYQVRSHGGWGIAIGICTVIEVLAFLLLLLRRVRHSAPTLRMIAAVMLGGKAIEAAWLVLLRSEEHTSELQSLMRISYAF